MQLIKTCEGEIINLSNATYVFYDGSTDETVVRFIGGREVTIARGNALNFLWTGRRDFTEVNYGA